MTLEDVRICIEINPKEKYLGKHTILNNTEAFVYYLTLDLFKLREILMKSTLHCSFLRPKLCVIYRKHYTRKMHLYRDFMQSYLYWLMFYQKEKILKRTKFSCSVLVTWVILVIGSCRQSIVLQALLFHVDVSSRRLVKQEVFK